MIGMVLCGGHGKRNKRIRDRNRKIHEVREQYRRDLEEARKKYGQHIPFGINLDKLK